MRLLSIECPTCGERYALTDGEEGRSHCETCGKKLEEVNHGIVLRTLLLSISCLILLVPANFFPVLRFSFQGQWRESEIVTGAILLFEQGSPVPALAVLFTSVIAPFALHIMICTACVGLLRGWYPSLTRKLWHMLFEFSEWGMIDIYLLALGVGAIKLLSMGSVEPKPGLWVVLLFVLISGLCVGRINACAIWTEIRLRFPRGTPGSVPERTCYHCGTVQEDEGQHVCAVCEAGLHERVVNDSRVWAYTLAATALYFPSNLLPVMNLCLLGDKADYTVMGGILYLWDDGDYVPAVIVFLGSMIVPVFKIVVLFYLLMVHRLGFNSLAHTKLFNLVKTLGRWSMVDVFVLGVLVALGQMGVMATVEPKPGAVAFCGMVIATMFAANNYEAWWLWHKNHPERVEEKEHAHGTETVGNA